MTQLLVTLLATFAIAYSGTVSLQQDQRFGAPVSNIFNNILPAADNTYDIGTSTAKWKNVFVQDITVSGTCTGCSGAASTFGTTSISAVYPLSWNTTSAQMSMVATSSLNLTVGSFLSPNISQWTNDSGYLTSLAGAASSTLLSDTNTWSGNNTFGTLFASSIGTAGNRIGSVYSDLLSTQWLEVSANVIDSSLKIGSSTNAVASNLLFQNTGGTGTLSYSTGDVFSLDKVINFGGGFVSQASSTFSGPLYGSGANLTLSRIGASTYSNLQDLQNVFHSAGWISGGTIADIGGNAVSVSAGTGLIRTSASAVGTISYFDWAASTTITVPSDSYRYIGIEYNSGSPRIASRTTYNWNLKTDFPLGNVVNNSGVLHLENAPFAVGDHAANMIKRETETMPYERDNVSGGLILGETGTRNITVSAGSVWQGLTEFPISAINTSGAGSFATWSYNGSAWTETTGVTQYPNTQYNNIASGLVTMSANRYANLWFYLETDGGLHMLWGTNEYNSLAGAEAEGVPTTIPDKISVHSFLIGRLIFQKSAASASEIQSVYTQTFSATAASDHTNLANLAWTASGHTGTANTIPYFSASGSALEFATSTLSIGGTALNVTGTVLVANGGTGATSFTSSQLLYGNGTAALSSVATTSATCSGSVSCSAFTVIGASPITLTGSGSAFAWTPTGYGNSTSTIIGFTGGMMSTASSTFNSTLDLSNATVKIEDFPAISYATSTAWTGTTTRALGPAFVAETWTGIKCYTNTGTVNVRIGDGTNYTNLFNASTTVGTVSLSTNNTFTAGEKREVQIGTPASSPTEISCTVRIIRNQ